MKKEKKMWLDVAVAAVVVVRFAVVAEVIAFETKLERPKRKL